MWEKWWKCATHNKQTWKGGSKRIQKRQHDNVATKFHWDTCKKSRLEHSEKWYEHAPEGAAENEEIKVLWGINIQCDNLIEATRTDVIVIGKKELDITCNVKVMQESALLGTARILRKVLKMQRREYSVSLWSFVMTRLTEEMTVITTTRILKTNNNNSNNNNNNRCMFYQPWN